MLPTDTVGATVRRVDRLDHLLVIFNAQAAPEAAKESNVPVETKTQDVRVVHTLSPYEAVVRHRECQ